MSRKDFESAIALAKQYEQTITIGGGEPTLHPHFKEFLFHAVWELSKTSLSEGGPAVHLVTNGSMTETAITIANLAHLGMITAAVSHDEYHDPIDPRVYKAFEKPKHDYYDHSHDNDKDYRSVNGQHTYIIPAGRAKKWGNHPSTKCVCDRFFIDPKGNVYPCGCKKTLLGHISQDLRIKYEYFEGCCEKTQEFIDNVVNGE
jgi:MoaA/NifB/PqqE/SkfB family radical SAM enzyme